MAEDRYRLLATVEGLQKFESDTNQLKRALKALESAVVSSVAGDLGASGIAQLREQVQALKGVLASRNVTSAENAYGGARAATRGAVPGSAEQEAFAKKEQVAHDKLLRAQIGVGDANIAQSRAKMVRIAQEDKVAARADKLILEAAETTRKAALTKSQALSPARILELTARGSAKADPSSTGALSTQQIAAQHKVADLEAKMVAAKQEALAGLLPQEQMERKLAGLTDRRVAANVQLQRHTDALQAALRTEAGAAELAAKSAQQNAFQRATSSFRLGFKGATEVPYLQQAGQAAKFSVLYGGAYKALAAISATFSTALQEGVAFQQGLSDMAIATGRPKEELGQLAERLASISADAGASPAAGLEIGARSIGLYGLAGSKNTAQQDYVAQLSTQIVTKTAMGNKDIDPVALQQNIAAVTQALGLGAGGQIRVSDLDAYFSKQFGVVQGSTLEAASQSASVGTAAGFSLEEVQAMAAQMISRTGQSSNAVGGYLAQIYSRGGEGSLTNVAGKYGIETEGRKLADVFRDLSKLYNTTDQGGKQEISAAFGRGKVQNAVVATLEGWDEIQKKAKAAERGAADGSLDKGFTERLNNIGGEINVLMGHFKEFAHLFGESGMLSVLGLAVIALDKTVVAINSVLGLYNELSPALRELIAVVATGALIGKVTGANSVIGGALKGQLPTALAARYGIAAKGEAPLTFLRRATVLTERPSVGQAAGVVEGTAAGAATNVGARGILAAGAAALRTVGPWVAVGGALIGISDIAKQLKNNVALTNNTLTALDQDPGYNASPTQLRNQAAQLKSAAAQERTSGSWFTQAITLGHGNDNADARATMLDAEAKRLAKLAKDTAVDAPRIKPITGFDKDSLAAGLDRISAQGGTAADRVKALSEAINGLGEKSAEVAGRIDSKRLAGTLAKAAKDFTGGADAGLNFYNDPESGVQWATTKELPGKSKTLSLDTRDAINKSLTPTEMIKRLDAAKGDLGIDNFAQITPEIATKMAESMGKLPADLARIAGVQDFVNAQIRKALLKGKADLDKLKVGATNLSDTDVVDTLNAVKSEFGGKIDARAESDYSGRIADARQYLAKVRQTRAAAGNKDLGAISVAINEARTLLGSSQIAQLQALRGVAVQNARSQAGATKAARPLIRKMIDVAIKTGNTDLLVQVIGTAGKGAVAIAHDAISKALKIARAASREADRIEAAARREAVRAAKAWAIVGGFTIGTGPGEVTPGVVLEPKDPKKGRRKSRREKELEAQDKALDTAGSDLNADKPGSVPEKPKEEEEKDSAAQIRAARAAMRASRKGGDIASGRAAIVQARADMADATKGTVAWYQALGSYYEARQGLQDALAAYHHNVRSLRIDTTDPVEVAQLALREARQKLARDRRRGKDVKAEDRVGIKDARISLESAAFSQRLGDVQTAEQLGRISHAAYLRYLQSEHNRLQAIGKRTRQQQDELNQIDGLMKEAAKAMQGAWNIGDIKLPTPYEVRKYVQQNAGLSANNRQSSVMTTVYIDGADTGLVKKIIHETVGKNAQVMTLTPRRA